ncbi:S-adenosyl-L-methionine-dependent methyltransferase [Apodospora peruviana]|uniref:S-adenosyl-L-methionine-dependent methyltransferase n=1 Tax=Apodospora peruviana TaxID=516989 RepID=A0AAE0LZC5_9PEZI|nr:S-adenosyl-L-methionine-dependent methyltransferase [Apodospora peruviana]
MTSNTSTATNKDSRFNAEATNWDANPFVQAATVHAHKALLSRLPPPEELATYDVLEMGCGTGLLSLLLAPSARSLTAVDAAEGMINVLKSKLATSHAHLSNKVVPVHALLEDPDDDRIQFDPASSTGREKKRRFDLITSHLVLHHIPDPLSAVLTTMYGCLKPGTGRVMLTDFENFGPEARRFHAESKMAEVERDGIGRDEMRELMEAAGFVDVKIEVAFEMDKQVEREPGSGIKGGPILRFPFLVCEGRRP